MLSASQKIRSRAQNWSVGMHLSALNDSQLQNNVSLFPEVFSQIFDFSGFFANFDQKFENLSKIFQKYRKILFSSKISYFTQKHTY